MSTQLEFDPGFDVRVANDTLAFEFGEGVFGSNPEFRRLDAIRPSLIDPHCSGPDPVYGISMDIGRKQDLPELERRMLLFGAVIYASGALGDEPVRSQGHVHAVAPHSGWSPPEIFEIWSGTAIIYAQEHVDDHPCRCIAVTAGPGDHIVVPPGWAHSVINADRHRRMSFGAWCDRQYGFDYRGVRAHRGLAWFPTFNAADQIEWTANPRYERSTLEQRNARAYPELGLDSRSLYGQFIDNPECVMFVPDPARAARQWPGFTP